MSGSGTAAGSPGVSKTLLGLSRQSLRILILVLLVAAALRTAFTVPLAESTFLELDGSKYQDVSRNLARGEGFAASRYYAWEGRSTSADALHPDLYLSPLLPALGGLVYVLDAHWTGLAKACSIGLGVVLVGLVFAVGATLFGTTAGLIAAGIFAVYPPAIYYSSRWSTENLCAIFLLAGLACLVQLRRRPAATPALLAGVALGLSCLARSAAMAQTIVFAGWMILQRGRLVRKATLLFLVGNLLVLAPWAVRNYRLTEVPNPLTFFGPYNVWLGMNESMYRMYAAGDDPGFRDAMRGLHETELPARIRELEASGRRDVRSVNRYWLTEAFRFASENRGKAISIVGHRLLHFWRLAPNRATASAAVVWASLLSFGPVMALALVSVIAIRRARDALLIASTAGAWLASLPFVFSLRYRFPVVDPYLVILASPALLWIAQRWAGASHGSVARSRS
jgi:4-amino-4-deoxy-L-arabinose transferase-like glycosyltransferase